MSMYTNKNEAYRYVIAKGIEPTRFISMLQNQPVAYMGRMLGLPTQAELELKVERMIDAARNSIDYWLTNIEKIKQTDDYIEYKIEDKDKMVVSTRMLHNFSTQNIIKVEMWAGTIVVLQQSKVTEAGYINRAFFFPVNPEYIDDIGVSNLIDIVNSRRKLIKIGSTLNEPLSYAMAFYYANFAQPNEKLDIIQARAVASRSKTVGYRVILDIDNGSISCSVASKMYQFFIPNIGQVYGVRQRRNSDYTLYFIVK